MSVIVVAPELGEDAAFAAETKLLSATEDAGVEAVLRDETRIHLQAMRALGDACVALPCLADVGAAADASRVLFARVTATAVSASLIDVSTRAELGVVTTSFREGFSQKTAARVVRALLAPDSAGALVVTVEPADARILVDGEPVAPGTRIAGLEVGAHTVEASRPGFAPAHGEVIVRAGEQVPYDVSLTEVGAGGEGEGDVSPLLLGGVGSLAAGFGFGAVGLGLAITPALLPKAEQRDAAKSRARDGTLVASALFAGATGAVAVVTGAAIITYSFLE